ncbi:MAG: glycosyltransferase [Nocardiopsaceae bacterium]|nr:glycosyltransferase [Nocardiopsaceae bacterium]
MALVHDVPVQSLPIARLEPVIGRERYERLDFMATRLRSMLGDRTIWNINSTAVGGGVAEMLQVLVGYVAGVGIGIRWSTITGDPAFFAITKQLHNQLHGAASDAGPLGHAEAQHYEEILAANVEDLLTQVRRGDIAILHDPQTAGMTEALTRAGVKVVWRCHVGIDHQNATSRAAWDFLRPYLASANAYVFTRKQFAPLWVPRARLWIIPPSIDPYSPKNVDLPPDDVRAILTTIGVTDDPGAGQNGYFPRADGSRGVVKRPAMVTEEGRPGPADKVVVQVSRWDRLKDMAGVMAGFAEDVLPEPDTYLMLTGPSVSEVADDPEGAMVFAECRAQWHRLPRKIRERVLLVTLPLDDVEENAAMVNAIQRRATVIVQKSLAEGFGLTVAEGMWKGRPVIGSAVGGIVDQIAPGTGILLPDPRDLAAFGDDVRWLLTHPDEAEQMGVAGKEYIREHFVGNVHLLNFAEVIEPLIAD